MHGLHIVCRVRFGLRGLPEHLSPNPMPEHPGRALKLLVAPAIDLVRMDVELLCKLDHGLLALDRGYRHSIIGKTIHWIVF